jgi:hypothetical protein
MHDVKSHPTDQTFLPTKRSYGTKGDLFLPHGRSYGTQMRSFFSTDQAFLRDANTHHLSHRPNVPTARKAIFFLSHGAFLPDANAVFFFYRPSVPTGRKYASSFPPTKRSYDQTFLRHERRSFFYTTGRSYGTQMRIIFPTDQTVLRKKMNFTSGHVIR